jgi:hypothetical protein
MKIFLMGVSGLTGAAGHKIAGIVLGHPRAYSGPCRCPAGNKAEIDAA